MSRRVHGRRMVGKILELARRGQIQVRGDLRGDLAEEARRLKEQVTGDVVVFGSAKLVRGLAAHDLVDEYRLMVHPVILVSGKRLFSEAERPSALQLADATKAGVTVILTFHPARAGA
ncbi:MAG: dihydrofolate reductase family protein [Actinomycetota bacterium]|nr:dihydrofolate reductase family protein [Actinomycetota bacterium]